MTVGARLVDTMVEVRVEDQGVGISRTEQERIFRKFYRGEATAKTVGSGETGLGLFLAEGLVGRDGRPDLGRVGRGHGLRLRLPAAGRCDCDSGLRA